MRIVVPFTDLRPETRRALLAYARGHALNFEYVGGSDTAYCELLQKVWANGETFAIVEHDIVVNPDTIPGFEGCPDPYCAAPYAWTTQVGPALGCTRFRAELLEELPDAIHEVAAMPSNWGAPGHYRQLDVFLMRRVLRDRHGLQPHVHLPSVEHLNPKQALLPTASPEPVLKVVDTWQLPA